MASLHLHPPFRADHVGSLLRPPALLKKRQLYRQGKCSMKELRVAEDAAVRHVVELQQRLGINTITDGEMRRDMFFEGVFDKLEGMTSISNRPITAFKRYIPHISLMHASGVKEAETVYCTGKIKRVKPFYVEDFEYLKNIVPSEDVGNIKITMCSPSWFHQRHGSDGTYDLTVYSDDDQYFDDLAVAYRAEIQELYDLGCRHIQFDDPTLCYFCSEDMIEGMKKAKVDQEALFDTYIRAINVCTQGRPPDLTVSVHMCRGNYMGMHFAEGGYSRIAAKLFSKLDVDVFYLEYDSERAGDFSPLKYLPLNKIAVLGLVTTKNAELESKEELKARVREAVEAMRSDHPERSEEAALNQLCISNQCGFASVWQGNPLTEEDEVRKLALLVRTAQEIWGPMSARI